MMASEQSSQTLKRLSTGIAGLDTILAGGFFQGSLYILRGAPGTGKTILSNQLIFHTIQQGGRAVYITLLGETNSRLFTYLKALSFFDPAPIGTTLLYLSASRVAESKNFQELHQIAKQAITEHRATVVVIDGLATMAALSASEVALKQFIRALQAYCETLGCTLLLLQDEREHPYAIDTAVDGILTLSNRSSPRGTMREVVISKLRGSDFLGGHHQFQITPDGLVVYPRTEALLRDVPPGHAHGTERAAFAIPGLDQMLHGGLPHGSVTVLLGTSGSGRTSLGLQFLAAGAQQQEAGLYFGFNEFPAELAGKAEDLGLDLALALTTGMLDLQWYPPFEQQLDALVATLLQAVRARSIRRLVIDGLEGFHTGADATARVPSVIAALLNELRRLQVTTLCTFELQHLVNPSIEVSMPRIAMSADNIIVARVIAGNTHLQRRIAIHKMRRSDFDPVIREFIITDQGIRITTPVESTEALLTLDEALPHAAVAALPPSPSP